MANEEPLYSSDDLEQLMLGVLAKRDGAVRQPLLAPDTLIKGYMQGFSPQECEIILWDFPSQAQLSRLLDNYQRQTGRELPFGMQQVVDAERSSAEPRWNNCILGRVGCATWTDDEWAAIVKSLPQETREAFYWDRFAMYPEDPAQSQAIYALAAGDGGEQQAGWVPSDWQAIHRRGRLHVGFRFNPDDGLMYIGTYSEQAPAGYWDLTLEWGGGYSITQRVRAEVGSTLLHQTGIETPDGTLPEHVYMWAVGIANHH